MQFLNELGAGATTAITIISLVLCVILIVAEWKIFEKAGEPGWKAIIPIYNLYIYFKISWGKGWMFLLTIIPVVGWIFPLIASWKLCKAFGKGVGFFILMLLIPFVAYLILGFGSDEYLGIDND